MHNNKDKSRGFQPISISKGRFSIRRSLPSIMARRIQTTNRNQHRKFETKSDSTNPHYSGYSCQLEWQRKSFLQCHLAPQRPPQRQFQFQLARETRLDFTRFHSIHHPNHARPGFLRVLLRVIRVESTRTTQFRTSTFGSLLKYLFTKLFHLISHPTFFTSTCFLFWCVVLGIWFCS